MYQDSEMNKHKYINLDAIRGIAAILIVLRHTPILFTSPNFHQSYLAVDLFFAMSGFVVANAYETRLQSGELTFRSFLKIRMIRLFPLYLAGTLIGLISHFTQNAHSENDSIRSILSTVSFALLPLLMLPSRSKPLYPTNNPAWSLFYEIIANSLYAKMIKKATTPALICIVVLAAIAIVICSYTHATLDAGWNLSGWYIALARISFAFSAGVILYRARPTKQTKSAAVSTIALLSAVLMLCMDIPDRWAQIGTVVEVIFVVPAIVYMATSYDPPSFCSALFSQLGKTSYGIYIIHVPVLILLSKLPTLKGNIYGWESLASFIVAIIIFSALMDRYFDSPMRKMISRILTRKTEHPVMTRIPN